MNKISISACVVFLTCCLFAPALKAQDKAPEWVTSGYSMELGRSYIETVVGEGATMSEARDNAANIIVQRRNLATGSTVEVTVKDGKIMTQGTELLNVKTRILDEYVEQRANGFLVYLLAQTAKNVDYDFEPVSVSDHYPFSARCLVPGMQQLYKEQTLKGVAFIAGEVVAVGGIIVAESLRADKVNMASIERDARRKTDLISGANTMQNVRNVFIGAAAAVYVWNVVDAIVSKGEKHIILDKVAFAPYADTEHVGLALNINL